MQNNSKVTWKLIDNLCVCARYGHSAQAPSLNISCCHGSKHRPQLAGSGGRGLDSSRLAGTAAGSKFGTRHEKPPRLSFVIPLKVRKWSRLLPCFLALSISVVQIWKRRDLQGRDAAFFSSAPAQNLSPQWKLFVPDVLSRARKWTWEILSATFYPYIYLLYWSPHFVYSSNRSCSALSIKCDWLKIMNGFVSSLRRLAGQCAPSWNILEDCRDIWTFSIERKQKFSLNFGTDPVTDDLL